MQTGGTKKKWMCDVPEYQILLPWNVSGPATLLLISHQYEYSWLIKSSKIIECSTLTAHSLITLVTFINPLQSNMSTKLSLKNVTANFYYRLAFQTYLNGTESLLMVYIL